MTGSESSCHVVIGKIRKDSLMMLLVFIITLSLSLGEKGREKCWKDLKQTINKNMLDSFILQ